jgi:hypothetical protein
MKDFLFLFRGGLDFKTATPEQIQQAMERWKIWMDDLIAQGKMNGGSRLMPTGATISGTEKNVTDGPFTEGKEIVGGYVSVKAADQNEAMEIAKTCPIFFYNGRVEVREVIPN